jgi:ribosome-interacting GTPase 1
MSHFTKIKTKLYNLEMLKKSLSDLNIEWTSEKQEITGYKDQKHGVELVLKQDNSHDLGFKWNGTEYELITDLMFWKQPYSVDKFLNQLNQRYAYNSIVEASEKQNFNFVKSESSANGTMRVVLRRYN